MKNLKFAVLALLVISFQGLIAQDFAQDKPKEVKPSEKPNLKELKEQGDQLRKEVKENKSNKEAAKEAKETAKENKKK